MAMEGQREARSAAAVLLALPSLPVGVSQKPLDLRPLGELPPLVPPGATSGVRAGDPPPWTDSPGQEEPLNLPELNSPQALAEKGGRWALLPLHQFAQEGHAKLCPSDSRHHHPQEGLAGGPRPRKGSCLATKTNVNVVEIKGGWGPFLEHTACLTLQQEEWGWEKHKHCEITASKAELEEGFGGKRPQMPLGKKQRFGSGEHQFFHSPKSRALNKLSRGEASVGDPAAILERKAGIPHASPQKHIRCQSRSESGKRAHLNGDLSYCWLRKSRHLHAAWGERPPQHRVIAKECPGG